MKTKLPDTQKKKINGNKIQKVGIRETYGEVIFNGKIIPANFSIYVSLIDSKGIHMSRLPEVLMEHSPLKIDKHSIKNILDVIELRSGDFCEDYYVKMSFNYAREIFSPVKKIKNIMLIPIKVKAKKIEDEYEIILEVVTPYTSLCPCSKEISKYSAHNQKSNAIITVTIKDAEIENLVNKLIEITENNSSCPISNILKREDEKYVTEKAYENPKFVEDVCRGIDKELNKIIDKEISDYSIVVNHDESIHSHLACAFSNAGRKLR